MMNGETNGQNLELQRIVRMLDKAVEMVHDGELTGSLAERSPAAVRNYNATLRHVTTSGLAPEALFAALPEDASLTDVGISSAQLAEYLRAGLPEPLQDAERGTVISRNLNIGALKLGGEDKDELSQIIREHLAEFLGEAHPGGSAAGQPAEPAASHAPSAAAAGSSGETPSAASRRALPSQQARVEEFQSEPQTQARR
jgi:hypothetical protein